MQDEWDTAQYLIWRKTAPAIVINSTSGELCAKAKTVAENINSSKVSAIKLDVSDFEKTVSVMGGHDSAISCVNYWYNFELSRAAIETRTNFLRPRRK